MIITISEKRLKQMAKRLRKVLRGLGLELKHFACLELAARLCRLPQLAAPPRSRSRRAALPPRRRTRG